MCNSKHENGRKIKKEGYGYKIFRVNKTTKGLNLEQPHKPTKGGVPTNEWIKWKKRYSGDGFCFFLTLTEAQKWTRRYGLFTNCVITEIMYKDGIEKHGEKEITIALCKQYKIII